MIKCRRFNGDPYVVFSCNITGITFLIVMWVLRRSAIQVKQFRICSEHVNALRTAATLLGSYKGNELPLGEEYNHERSVQAHGYSIDRNIPFSVYTGIARGFASRVTGSLRKKKENSDESESFSELDVPPEEASLSDSDNTEVLSLHTEGEVSEGEVQVDSALPAAEGEGDGPCKNLLEDIFKCTYKDVPATIDKWVKDGNEFHREEAKIIIRQLKMRKMFGRALQVSNWLWAKKTYVFDDSDHAVRLDMIFRLYGISRAETYFQTIPLEMRGYRVLQIHLLNFSRIGNAKKAEEVFNEMKDAEFFHSIFDYNAMLRVYHQTDKRKISNLLKMMEDESVKPTAYTYNHLIHAKGVVGDIVGMEKILETMKAEGMQTDQPATLTALAKHYICAGYLEKAEALLKELEGNATAKDQPHRLKTLLLLYAEIGKPTDVERVWNAISSHFDISNSLYVAGIRAWGKLGEIEKAESMFEKMLNSGMKVASPVAYCALLDVYAKHNMFLKAKEFVKPMSDNSQIIIEPRICGEIVKTYLKSGDVEEADAFLLKVCKQKKVVPYYNTFIALLEKHAEKGDIANAEKVFDSLVKIGYHGRIHSYECLLQAYLKAQAPAYGFKERMLAAKLQPNNKISTILEQVNASFKKEHLQSDSSDLLD